MKRLVMQTLSLAALVVLAAAAIQGARAAEKPPMKPDKLVILSTTDVKGKTSPCG